MRVVVESLPMPSAVGAEPKALAATGTDPAPTATQNATLVDDEERNTLSSQPFRSDCQGFAKPLRVSKPFGGSNHPPSPLNGRLQSCLDAETRRMTGFWRAGLEAGGFRDSSQIASLRSAPPLSVRVVDRSMTRVAMP